MNENNNDNSFFTSAPIIDIPDEESIIKSDDEVINIDENNEVNYNLNNENNIAEVKENNEVSELKDSINSSSELLYDVINNRPDGAINTATINNNATNENIITENFETNINEKTNDINVKNEKSFKDTLVKVLIIVGSLAAIGGLGYLIFKLFFTINEPSNLGETPTTTKKVAVEPKKDIEFVINDILTNEVNSSCENNILLKPISGVKNYQVMLGMNRIDISLDYNAPKGNECFINNIANVSKTIKINNKDYDDVNIIKKVDDNYLWLEFGDDLKGYHIDFVNSNLEIKKSINYKKYDEFKVMKDENNMLKSITYYCDIISSGGSRVYRFSMQYDNGNFGNITKTLTKFEATESTIYSECLE